MPINIARFNPLKAEPAHEGTIIGCDVLPEGMSAPFEHFYGYLDKPGTAMAGHSHPTDEIYIVLFGAGIVIVGGENRNVKAGDTVVIPAGSWHTMLCPENGAAPMLWAAFWWEKTDFDNERDKAARTGVHTWRFDKGRAQKGHNDTILADIIVPGVIAPPFGHAYGYLENGGSMEAHSHPTSELYIVYSGGGVVTVGDETREIGPGDVIQIPPGKQHSMTEQGDGALLWAAFWWEV